MDKSRLSQEPMEKSTKLQQSDNKVENENQNIKDQNITTQFI